MKVGFLRLIYVLEKDYFNSLQFKLGPTKHGALWGDPDYDTDYVNYLTLWMLGNFLKIDYTVVCFLKPVNSACFLWVMIDWVANRLDLRPAAELLALIQPVCISMNAVPALKGLSVFLWWLWTTSRTASISNGQIYTGTGFRSTTTCPHSQTTDSKGDLCSQVWLYMLRHLRKCGLLKDK